MAGKTYIKVDSSTWTRIKKIYMKTGGTTWTAIRKAYIKIGASAWAKVYDTASNRPYLSNSDRPRIRLNSYRTAGYIEAEPVQQMGPPTTNPTNGWPTGTIGDYLWGADANTLSNWVSGNGSAMTSTYQWYQSSSSDPNTQILITAATVSSGATDKFQNAQAYIGQYDNKYIWFKPTYTNSAGSASAISNPVLIVKQLPVRNSSGLSTPTTGAPIDTAWTYTFDVDDVWYDSVDKAASRVEWFLETSNTSPVLNATTRVKTDYISNIFTQGSGIITGSSSYTPTTAGGAIGKYVYIRLVLVNSNTLYQYPTTGYIAHEMSRGPITGPATVDIYPTLSKLDTYLTVPATGLYTGITTDGNVYTQCRLRGNTGSYTPNPANIFWKYEYGSSTSGPWSTFYDSGGNYTSAISYDTLENQNHDYYLEDYFYTNSAGLIPNDFTNRVTSIGKYIKFTATANPTGTPTTNSITIGPIYDYTTSPGTPTLTWSSTYDANNSYITAYWSAATKIGTYYLQYNTGSSWVSLGSGTTTTPTSGAQAGPYLVPHGTRLFRVINQNPEGVYAKSSSISFDSTPPPGNVTDVRNFNWTTFNSQIFLTTGIRTTSVSYTFISTNISGFSIGPITRSTTNSYPYLFTDNLSAYFVNRGAYVSTNVYNVGDYVSYGGFTYFVKSNGVFGYVPTNTTYWTATAAFNAYVTPFNNLKAGSATVSSSTLLLSPSQNMDPPPTIGAGPTFDLISQTSFRINYNPNTYSTYAVIDVQTAGTSILGYPKSVVTTTNANNTDSVSGRTANTLHYVYITPRYMYNNTYSVYYDGVQVNNPVTTLSAAPNAFNYSLSQAGSVTAPSTPSITRVSSTSNTVLFEIGVSKPADTLQYGVNQSGAAFGTRTGSPAQTIQTLNQWDANGNVSASGTYDTISTIELGSNNSAMTISTTAYGTTRQANINVNTTTGASSWAINFSWSGVSTGTNVTYYSNGIGSASSSTASTVTVYTNSMPAVLATITGTNDPTITINNVTAYSGSNQSGSTTAGTAGTPTSSVISRPTSTSASTTQYYTYYTAAVKLATPTGVSATTTRSDGINITWSAVSGAAYYGIWWGGAPSYDSAPDFGGPLSNGGWNGTGTSFLDTTITAGSSRTYYVQAYQTNNPTGTKSDWSSGATGTRASATLKPPNDPTGLTTPSSGTSPNLVFNSSSWTAPTVDSTHNAATYYQVYIEAATASGGPYYAATNTFSYNYYSGSPLTVSTNANTAATAANVYATSISSGTVTDTTRAYTWVKMWVRAANADGYSNWVSNYG